MASNSTKSEEKKYACNFEGCSASFRRFYRLTCHSRVHKNERPYVCSYDNCDKSYIELSHLKRHEDIHVGKFKCTEDNCDKIFISRATLKKHVDNIHLKKKPKTYKCSHCDQDFSKHSWLAKHEYRHTNIKPYQCPHEDCEKGFLVPSKLKKHMKVHNGYPCSEPDCNEILTTWTLYLKHLKVAHPKIHRCDICEKIFSDARSLKNHLVIHQLERTAYVCPEPDCIRYYFVKRNLKFHIKSYHEKCLFKCSAEYCHKAFITESALNAHLPQHDPNKRLRKRKKKKKCKPTFAAVLSGSVKKSENSETENCIETENSAITEVTEEYCKVNEEKQEDISENDNEIQKNYVYDDIYTLLSMVIKKNDQNDGSTSIKSNLISLKA